MEKQQVQRAQRLLTFATMQILRPLVALMLRHGITFQAFSTAAKKVFVRVARDDFAIPGKRQSKSRIALLTGLTRPDVTQLMQDLEHMHQPAPENWNRAHAVLDGWHSDPEFVDGNGFPRSLTYKGADSEFANLVRRYGSDVPKAAVLDELRRAGSVVTRHDGRVAVVRNWIKPERGDEEALSNLGQSGARLVGALAAKAFSRDFR